jgi:short-subunit dehydrogenase
MLLDKVVIITGASSGIGRALALEFARKGCRLVLAARNPELLSRTAEDCEKSGAKTVIVVTDVADEQACKNLVDKAIANFSRIDILVNNAGVTMRALFCDLDISVLKRLMDVNFWGAVYCTKLALPYLLESKGTVVGISSVAGYRGLPGRTGYSASKFALNGFLETLRSENLKTGLRVLIAAPGYTASNIRNTALTKDGSVQAESPRDENQMMSTQKVAVKIVRAIQKNKKYLYLTSLGKATIWVNKFFPVWMDKRVYKTLSKEPDSPFK